MKKLIGILVTATSICTSPGLAQSYDPDNGTGNLVTATIVAPAPAVAGSKIVAGRRGTNAFAMSARRKVDAGAAYGAEPGYTDSGNTGGGSAGYNEMLRNW
jgi:hypothetical protein